MIIARCQWADGTYARDVALASQLEPGVLHMPFTNIAQDREVEVSFVREHETVAIETGDGTPILIMRSMLTAIEAFGAIISDE